MCLDNEMAETSISFSFPLSIVILHIFLSIRKNPSVNKYIYKYIYATYMYTHQRPAEGSSGHALGVASAKRQEGNA